MPIRKRRFLVIDFETLTPSGRSAEPIEVAGVIVGPDNEIDAQSAISRLIRPPVGVSMTQFDIRQTGIQPNELVECPLARVVLGDFEVEIGQGIDACVAHHASYEANIVSRWADVCPLLANIAFIDTIALVRYLLPRLPNYRLETVAEYLQLSMPPNRHRALPDARLTACVFQRMIELGEESLKIPDFATLLRIAALRSTPRQSSQGSLFEF